MSELSLVTKPDYKQSAKEVLEEALTHEFENVIVMGFKDNNIMVKSSKWERTIVLIGALEYAKQYIYENQEEA